MELKLKHPILFSIPSNKIVIEVPIKKKFLSNLIPGDGSTYIYTLEESYYNEYKQSLFATTFKKAGWDCMRHYEILANGCIPYFPNIELCPEYTLYLFPKDLIIKGNNLYNKISNNILEKRNINKTNITDINKGIINHINTKYNISNEILEEIYSNINISVELIEKYYLNECNTLINELLNYTKAYLTSKSISQYILNTINNKEIIKILFLSGDITPDYLRDLTLHGFKELFKNNCCDYPIVPSIYEEGHSGGLHSISNLLTKDYMIHYNSDEIKNNIINKYYSIIIYGSYHRGMPYYDLIKNVYEPSNIILLCGEDCHCCNYKYYIEKGHYVFIRELVT